MSDERWEKVGKLLEKVEDLPPNRWVAYLEEHCEEEGVRQEVLSLLDASHEADAFFGRLESAVPSQVDNIETEAAGVPEQRGADPLGLEGERVEHYVVEEHVGGGGMGMVYQARDSHLGRPTALKFLPPRLADNTEARRRFVREARSAAVLDHPHIARIYETSTSKGGLRYIAMAYYDGETLSAKISRGSLSVGRALLYAEQIASALAEAHEADIVHRDVKPSNVVIASPGETKLLDFGVAKAIKETRLTRSGQLLGSVSYMSPEQAEGGSVGPPADVWALGVVLYEMLAGTRPFNGRNEFSVLQAIQEEDPVSVQEHRPSVAPEIRSTVMRCLQKDPGQRYASAGSLLEDIQAAREA
jgi:serine/threonine protein kinase